MATIQRSTTKVANKLVSYAEKRAEVTEGVNAPAEYAKAQFKATRELWGKNGGIQAHHVIQSFKPDEVSPEKANQIGQELADKIAPGHEAVVYTHTDKEHTHNHLVINSVNFENGKKYHAHGKDELYNIREASDDLCKEYELSIVQEKSAGMRHTLAEQGLLEKGKSSWKDEIRQAIDVAKDSSTDFNDFKRHLEQDYGVETKLRGQTLSFKHPDQQRYVRANKLGMNYEMEGIKRGFERQIGAGTELERTPERNAGTQQTDDELHSGANERGLSQGLDRPEPVGANTGKQQSDHLQHGINFEQARTVSRKQQRSLARGFDEWTKAAAGKQQQNHREVGRTGKEQSEKVRQHERGNEQEHGQDREQHEKPRGRHKERDEELSL